MSGEKSWRQLHKNALSNIEQILEAAPHKAAAVRLPTTHQKTIQVRRTRHVRRCWRNWDELISDILPWTPSHGRTNAGRPARIYLQLLCIDTGCSLDDLPEAMNDRHGWRKRISEIRAGGATWWWVPVELKSFVSCKVIKSKEVGENKKKQDGRNINARTFVLRS